MFIDDGLQAIVWEFTQDALGASFTKMLWSLLLRDDDMSTILLRFIWAMPLKFKRKFIAAIDAHLSDRYPMFKGLSENWPGGNYIHPYVRPAEERKNDFELVTTGYLGYRALGYSLREVDMFVWLEVLRDKQCEDRPCEQGVFGEAKRKKGGCPVAIHIPDMLNLMGQGKLKDALTLIQASNPLPDVTGRVCPQEHCSARASAPSPAGRSRSASWNGTCPSASASPARNAAKPPSSRRITFPLGSAPRSRRSRWSVPVPPA